MDLRRYFKKPRLEMELDQTNSELNEKNIKINPAVAVIDEATSSTLSYVEEKNFKIVDIQNFEFDIGNFINHENLSDEIIYKALKQPWVPENAYNFKKDSSDKNRSFRLVPQWLTEYPFISYSAKLKGILCRYCVLFKPNVDRGVQGHFIIKEFSKYKDFHDSVKQHLKSKWHCESTNRANDFSKIIENKNKSVVQLMNSTLQNTIEYNWTKLISIVKSIVFCGTNNIPLRGSTDETAIFNNLLKFRIDAGDNILNDHLLNSPSNATYISHRIQNEIIDICNEICICSMHDECTQKNDKEFDK